MKNVLFILIFSLFLTSCTYGQRFNDPAINKINFTVTAIEKMYVDTINKQKLADDAVISLLQKLDPHSGYLSPKEMKDMNEPLQGEFDGIGVQFNMLTDTLYVIQVIPGGPSEKVGIRAGDRIIMVNDTLIAGVKMETSDVMSRLKGRKGTEVELKIMRGNDPKLISFKVIRDKIPMHSLDASYMIDKETGYIKFSRFAATTYNEFMEALTTLKEKGMKNLILDLQDNGGGYMMAAAQIANEFLKKGSLIVYTEGTNQRRMEEYARNKGSFTEGKLVVLINEYSASASEIVTGALQDWDRAVLIGRRTFGKGLVQQVYPYPPDGSAIKLTVARYYTPTGRSIQKPYENGNIESYNMDLLNRYNSGEMVTADSIHFPDSLKYNTLVNKRDVYGGGGIMPDYFIPIDTTRFTDIHRALIASGTLYKYVINYVDAHRESIRSKYPNSQEYKSKFIISDKMLNDLLDLFKSEDYDFKRNKSVQLSSEDIEELKNNDYKITEAMLKKFSSIMKTENEEDKQEKEKKSIELTADDLKNFEKSKSLIQLQIKSLIARDIWDMTDYFEIINETNDPLKKAIEIIRDDQEYNKLLGNKK